MADVPPPRDVELPGRDLGKPEFDGPAPPGTPRYGWFAGVLEGRLGDAEALRAATESVASLGIVGCDLEVEGGRFSFMFDEQPVAGRTLTLENQDALVAGLQRLVTAAAQSIAIESTLRSSLVHDTSVIETLFSIRDGRVEPVSRRRELEERDRAHDPQSAGADGLDGSISNLGPRRAAVLIALIVVGGSLLAWNRGYVDLLRNTFLARAATDLESRTGPFGDALELTFEQRFGKYVCTVRRGPGYPTTAAAVEALIDAAETAEDRAAASAIGNGGVIGVVLVDEKGERLGADEIQLAGLLSDPEAELEATLPAKLLGHRIELSLDSSGPSTRRSRSEGEKGD